MRSEISDWTNDRYERIGGDAEQFPEQNMFAGNVDTESTMRDANNVKIRELLRSFVIAVYHLTGPDVKSFIAKAANNETVFSSEEVEKDFFTFKAPASLNIARHRVGAPDQARLKVKIQGGYILVDNRYFLDIKVLFDGKTTEFRPLLTVVDGVVKTVDEIHAEIDLFGPSTEAWKQLTFSLPQ